jgi:hypothetical protein
MYERWLRFTELLFNAAKNSVKRAFAAMIVTAPHPQ